eukprot:59385-Chlamydomonas_euryale.AAC.1
MRARTQKLLVRLAEVRASVMANPDVPLPGDVRTLRQARFRNEYHHKRRKLGLADMPAYGCHGQEREHEPETERHEREREHRAEGRGRE